MNRFGTARTIFIAALIVAASMYAVNALIERPIASRSRMLLIGGGTGEYWPGAVAGGQEAARGLCLGFGGIAASGELGDQPINKAGKINPSDYGWVGISP